MKVLSILLFLVLHNGLLLGQKKSSLIAAKFRQADSVLLISHDDVKGGTNLYVDNEGKKVNMPALISNGKLNNLVVMERRRLSTSQIDTLIALLTRPFRDLEVLQGGCYVPHHAVVLFSKNKTSYIDVCFQCNSFRTSKDLEILDHFDSQRWKDLLRFFQQFSFTYEMADLE